MFHKQTNIGPDIFCLRRLLSKAPVFRPRAEHTFEATTEWVALENHPFPDIPLIASPMFTQG
jgi:hypothetical protein